MASESVATALEFRVSTSVPVFIWTLQFYKTYYSNVFYF